MNCPGCGKEMRKGFAEAKNAGSLTQSLTQVVWYPEAYREKHIRRDAVELGLKAEGYYCDECMKVFAVFEENKAGISSVCP